MSKQENFWQRGKDEKELKSEVAEGLEEALAPDSLFVEEYEEGQQEQILPGLIDADKFFRDNGEEKAEEIFGWYEKAITRRGREALGSSSFMYHFFTGGSTEKNYMYGDDHDGYVLGIVRHGVFVPSHFAPRTMRGGYNLIKDLGESQDIPVVLAITDDLVKTIEKMPSWHNLGIDFPARFRGEVHNKQIVYNSHPDVQNLLPLLAEDYLNEAKNLNYEDYDGSNESPEEDDSLSQD